MINVVRIKQNTTPIMILYETIIIQCVQHFKSKSILNVLYKVYNSMKNPTTTGWYNWNTFSFLWIEKLLTIRL